MRRREFIQLAASTGMAWPLAGHAQQPERLHHVGLLIGFSKQSGFAQAAVTAFANGLQQFGWVERKNIRFDYRFAAGNPALYTTYAGELVGVVPDVILASPGPGVFSLQQRTRTIPIVFVLLPDPVELGVVQSLARPGGNITGFASYDASMIGKWLQLLIGKWLQLLKEVAPGVGRVAVIFDPDTAYAPSLDPLIEAARSFGVTVTIAPVHDDAAVEEAIAAQAREPEGGLICLPDSFNETHRDLIITAAARHGLPLIGTPTFPRAGGLMSYSFDPIDLYTQAASYVDRILRGASPAELPVQYPTKYSLIINLKTAKALGLTVPPNMLDLADEVIE